MRLLGKIDEDADVINRKYVDDRQVVVNNGKLTIQKNGTAVQTFTANQSSDVTANITVPTKTSELTNNSGFITSSSDITGTAKLASGLKPVCAVGSDDASSNGWYKVATSTLSGWGNQNLLYYIKGGYSTGYVGILEMEMRSDNTSISCWRLNWVARNPAMTEGSVILVVNGMTWTMYVNNPSTRYGRVYFTEISNRSIQGDGTYAITYFDRNSTKETTTPTATYTSSDGWTVLRAKQDGDGNLISSTYLKNNNMYINTHPENSPDLIPFIHNDIAYLNQRGGSYVVKYDGTTQSINIDNVFDASPSYWAINPTGTTTIVIELTLHKVFGWTNTIYCDFGSTGWRSKKVKIEVMNSNYSNDVWSSKLDLNNNSSGNVKTTFNHTPVGADNAGAGFNKIKFTFSDWGTATIFRIAQLGVYNYGSMGVRETYMSRGRNDEIYRSITPATNNTYDLGTSAKKWANVYATTFTGALSGNATTATSATKATGDKNGNDITTTYQPKLVSGTNIKTINNTSLLGSGNIDIQSIENAWFCTCTTAANTAAKVLTCSESGFTLKEGTVIAVAFTNTNTASSVTLNVNSSGAKSISDRGTVYTGNDSEMTGYAGRILYYMYNGTTFDWLNIFAESFNKVNNAGNATNLAVVAASSYNPANYPNNTIIITY